jgi:hypothetical protein
MTMHNRDWNESKTVTLSLDILFLLCKVVAPFGALLKIW